MMYAAKAWAAVVGYLLATLARFYLASMPGWAALDVEVRGTLTTLLCGGIVWIAVYLAPANRYEDVPLSDP